MQRTDPVYVISVAAQLAQMHPQTLRQYDRLGLVVPQRRNGSHRRYSPADVDRLRRIYQLSGEGISLEGIRRVIEMEAEAEELRTQVRQLRDELLRWRNVAQGLGSARVFSAGLSGEVSIKSSERDAMVRSRRSWQRFELTAAPAHIALDPRQDH